MYSCLNVKNEMSFYCFMIFLCNHARHALIEYTVLVIDSDVQYCSLDDFAVVVV